MSAERTPLTRNATIYELTDDERACMKRLIDAGLVVTIGEHSRVKRDRSRLIECLRDMIDEMPASGDAMTLRVLHDARALLREFEK